MLKLIIILQLFTLISCNQSCQECSSQDPNSDCQKGTSKNTVQCSNDKQYCYKQEFIGENGSRTYQRGCGVIDRCDRQARKLGASLKCCAVCNQCDNCNNKPIKQVENIGCQRCASEDPMSDCRNGTIKEKFQCPSDEPACYTEDILNKGRPPFYRRGCAPVDWCQSQKNDHSDALKFCSVCTDRNMCNDKRIGSKDPSKLQCYSCNSEDFESSCRTGSIDNNSITCVKSTDICLQYYVATSQRNIWVRQCAKKGRCDELGDQYGHSLETCTECDDDYCNNVKMKVAL